MMKLITLYKRITCALCLSFLFGQLAMAGPSPDDPDTMERIVLSPMLPVAMTEPVDTGTLLFSDSPEYPEEPGILYGDKVSGDCRLYFYHVNQSTEPRKIVAVAYNPQEEPADIVIKGVQYTRPSTSYYVVGKELSTLYYEGNMTINKVTVPGHSYALLSERLNHITVLPEQLFSGIVDMELPVPMYISAVILPAAADPIAFMSQQRYLPSDSVKLRGTFQGKDRYLRTLIPYSPKDGIGYIKIADGISDRFLLGRDVMDQRYSENVGNYGVDYTIRLRTKGNGPIHLYFNSQGGEYAGVAELLYRSGTTQEEKKIAALPEKKLSMGANDPYAMQYLDTFAAGTDVTVHIMPPGAANLPVRILLVPDEALRKAADEAGELKKLREKGQKQVEAERSEREIRNKTAAAEAKQNTVQPRKEG